MALPPASPSSEEVEVPPLLRQPLATVKPTPLHPLEEVPLSLQDTRTTLERQQSRPDSAPSSRHTNNRAHTATSTSVHLPVKGDEQDAQAAVDKLDRLAKARQAKRNWSRGTGVSAIAHLVNPKRHQPRSKHHHHDESDSEDDLDSARRDEVKLMVTGHPVIGKVFHAASRAKDRLRGGLDSPDVSPQNEDIPFRFPIGRPASSLSRRFRGPSATPEPPSNTNAAFSPTQPSPTPPSEGTRIAASSSHRAAVSPEPALRESSEHVATEFMHRPRSTLLAARNPELMVVDEEGHNQGAPDSRDQLPLRRPNLAPSESYNSQTPSSLVSSDVSSSRPSPGLEAPPPHLQGSSSVSSFTGGPLHDEPDAHDTSLRPDRGGHSTASPSSRSEASSDDEDDDDLLDDSALASDDGGDMANVDGPSGFGSLRHASISLEHGETLTKEQLKRRKRLIRREIKRRKANGEPIDDLLHVHGRAGNLGHKVTNRVSKGIHYASSQSRNRRAMERYSPHPAAPPLSLQTKDLPRSTTPLSASAERAGISFSAVTPSMSRGQNPFSSRRASVASSRRSSVVGAESLAELAEDDADGGGSLRRFDTGDRSMLSSRNSIRQYLHAPSILKRRRQKKWEAEVEALERAANEEAQKHDADAELDKMLAKVAREQAPSDAHRVKYEFDVLYENQRGLLVFGIPKFSPRTLFQWDPSPWTSANNLKSPYNIANAQLPDPSWEWVYPEWFIDMTGDTDEAGWQYSGNFGRRFWPNIHFPHGRVGLPRTGVEGIREMNARLAEKEAKRKEKESHKEDDGLEALKRSALARSSKWTGSPDAWTFVRRRRWIRLRRRKPLASAAHGKEDELSPPQSKAASPNLEKVPDSKSMHDIAAIKVKPGHSDAESSLAGTEESDTSSDSDSSEDDPDLYATANARPSGFLPRRLPGRMANGRDPTRSRDASKKARARRQAREFTGTIRELKTLLPSIIAMDRDARLSRSGTGLNASQSSYKWAQLKLKRVDARNPFISWKFVKLRLHDDDMAFASSTLRTIERKYQQRRAATLSKVKADGGEHSGVRSHRRIPSGLMGSGAIAVSSPARKDAGSVPSDHPGARPSAGSGSLLAQDLFRSTTLDGNELTREALIEINFARVLRVLRACKVDRQRLDLWKLWLGVESLDHMMDTTRCDDLGYLGLLQSPADDVDFSDLLGTHGADAAGGQASPPLGNGMSGGSSLRYRNRAEKARARWRASVSRPDPSDVWDVLERKLDDVLLLFEFQSNRASLIRLLLTVHEQLHSEHVYRDRSLRSNPLELSPAHVHGEPAEMGGGVAAGGAFGGRRPGWQQAGLPRLEFFSDLQAILSALPGNEAATNQTYILAKLPSPAEAEAVAMPRAHRNSVIEQLEAQAQSATACPVDPAHRAKAKPELVLAGADVVAPPDHAIAQHRDSDQDQDQDQAEAEAEAEAKDADTTVIEVDSLPPWRPVSPRTRPPSVPLPYRTSALSPPPTRQDAGLDGAVPPQSTSPSTPSKQPPVPKRSDSVSPDKSTTRPGPAPAHRSPPQRLQAVFNPPASHAFSSPVVADANANARRDGRPMVGSTASADQLDSSLPAQMQIQMQMQMQTQSGMLAVPPRSKGSGSPAGRRTLASASPSTSASAGLGIDQHADKDGRDPTPPASPTSPPTPSRTRTRTPSIPTRSNSVLPLPPTMQHSKMA
ncbi:hypothetical protein BCV70DRAFT_199408 [Testicularia cyperi]|uniref:Peroxin/Ferlin domain-containing protein n=1 Tax=Testicularia cyperi TaxID=1882483 RepID=A0A317XUJ9_9BASI|nr:hypothetical protein BCV70DRAFT_199408 [Testicularia cyperi]